MYGGGLTKLIFAQQEDHQIYFQQRLTGSELSAKGTVTMGT